MPIGSLSPQSVTVIGAGNSGCAFAADLASRGVSVMLYGHPDHRGYLPMIEDSSGWLKAKGNEVNGEFQIKTTSDLYLAIKHSSFLVATVPAYGQETILRTLSQFDLSKHVLIITVGNFFYLAARQKVNCHAILEADTSPYAVRIANDTVLVKGIKKSLNIWAEPPTTQIERNNHQAELALRQQVEFIFSPSLLWCQNLLEVGLNNINAVIHCPAALMNAGWIESTSGDFFFYGQGMSPSVSKVVEKADQERLAIGRAYGIDLVDITTHMNRLYQQEREFNDFRDFAAGSTIHNKTKGAPTDMKHRYMSEDICFGMVPWYELGLKCGLASPTIRALIEMASIVSGVDYLEHGRTLRSAGLGEATKEQVLMALGGPLEKTPHVLTPLSDSLVNTGANTLATQVLQKPQVAA